MMKSIIVNVQIQFDQFDDEPVESYVFNTLNSINSLLQERFSNIQPQIFCNDIDDDDIEVVQLTDEL